MPTPSTHLDPRITTRPETLTDPRQPSHVRWRLSGQALTRRRTAWWLGWSWLVLLGIGVGSGAAQAQSGDRAQATDDLPTLAGFGESVDVRVINLEAVVTRRGERVQGLGPEDFVLEVDGQSVPIEYFTEVRGGRTISNRSGSAVASANRSTLPILPAGKPVTTWYLIFVDDYFSIASRRDRVLDRLEDQVERLQPHDRMAVVAYDGRRLEMLSSWTGSKRQLERALRKARERPAYGLQRRSEWRRVSGGRSLRSRQGTGRSFSSIGFSGAARSVEDPYGAGNELSGKVSRVASAAAAALRSFASPDGRKVMLLLSGGLPLTAEGAELLGPSFTEVGSINDILYLRRLMGPLLESANRLGYTLYPVDLGEIAGGLVGAEVGSLYEASVARDSADRQDRLSEDVLHHLAEATGGKAFVDGGRFNSLELAMEDTRAYYWLGFTPTWKGDDGVHEVRLKVRDGGKVRSRRSYADLSRQALLTMQIESAHLFDMPIPEARSFEVEIGQPKSRGWGKVELPLLFRVPTDGPVWVETAAGKSADLELRIAATDDRGYEAEIPVIALRLEAPSAVSSRKVVTWSTALELRRRPHRLLLVLHDPISGALWAHRLEIRP